MNRALVNRPKYLSYCIELIHRGLDSSTLCMVYFMNTLKTVHTSYECWPTLLKQPKKETKIHNFTVIVLQVSSEDTLYYIILALD